MDHGLGSETHVRVKKTEDVGAGQPARTLQACCLPLQPPGSGGDGTRRTRGSERRSRVRFPRSIGGGIVEHDDFDPDSARGEQACQRCGDDVFFIAGRNEHRTASGRSQWPVSEQLPEPGSRYSSIFHTQSTAGTAAQPKASPASQVSLITGGCFRGFLDTPVRSVGQGASFMRHRRRQREQTGFGPRRDG